MGLAITDRDSQACVTNGYQLLEYGTVERGSTVVYVMLDETKLWVS